MKTPAAIKKQVAENGFSVINLVPEEGIAEIQRDAREGMVPVSELKECQKAYTALDKLRIAQSDGMVPREDIGPLIAGLENIMEANEPYSGEYASHVLEVFRAKHPNLFTK